jgi:hypothetical protein
MSVGWLAMGRKRTVDSWKETAESDRMLAPPPCGLATFMRGLASAIQGRLALAD